MLVDFTTLFLVLTDREAYRIRSLEDAAVALLNMWPDDDGEAYIVAVKACLDAMLGDIKPEVARLALIRAAEEAGIPVITVVN
jgi:sugar/nucleoside kinase (ribokinase family)